jgi:hypothetical protein
MAADLYRDARLGLRSRIGELVGRIREREGDVTDAFWASLDDEAKDRVSAMFDAIDLVTAGKELSFEEMAQAEADLARGLARVDDLFARLPALEEEWSEAPDEVEPPPPPSEPWPLLLLARGLRDEVELAFTQMVRERDAAATVVRDERRSWLATFSAHGAPFALRATAYSNGSEQLTEVPMCLVTSVPRSIPRLLVRHETVLLAFGKALGVKHEVEVGEPSFDGLFLIEGEESAAKRMLTPRVRSHLLALARYDVPTLDVDPPRRRASISWRFEPAPAALEAAVRVLASVRETDARVRFRR